MKLLVIMPAKNEEKSIGQVIRNIPRDIADKVEVLVVNDGSTDNTSLVAKEAGADYIIENGKNLGVGHAFFLGINEALKKGADIIVNIDADGQFDPNDIKKLIDPILKNQADMVTASRFIDKSLIPEMPFMKKIGNIMFSRLVSRLSGEIFFDTQCGFRAYSREACLHMNLFGKFTYTQEVFIDLISKDMRIKEVPVKIYPRRYGESKVVGNVFLYGFRALGILLRSFRDYKPLKFFGGIGAVIFFLGFLIGLFMFLRWLRTGSTTPFRSLLDVALLGMVLGAIIFLMALVADMLDRSRKLQEQVLYYERKKELGK